MKNVTYGRYTITAYQVPAYEEEPSEEMIDWLNENPGSWEGDDCGICFHTLSAAGDVVDTQIAEPGNWVVRFKDEEAGIDVYVPSKKWVDPNDLAELEPEMSAYWAVILYLMNDDQAMLKSCEPAFGFVEEGAFMTARQLQFQIADWASKTFGVAPIGAIAIRGNKEMAELLSGIQNNQHPKELAEECADVAFFLMQICERLDFNLFAEVQKKFEINKRRSWAKAKDGSFQHVEAAE